MAPAQAAAISPALQLQRRIGNDATQRFFAQAQRAAAVSSPHDPTELEAHAMARQVVRMSDASVGGLGTATQATPGATIQRAAAATAPAAAPSSVVLPSGVGAGAPLPSGVRSYMEPRFGASFSNVRVHTGEHAAQMSQQLGAHAFTVGEHVFFGRDQFRPDTDSGRELIAHELTHTVQQGAAVQRSADPNASPLTVSERSAPQVQRLGLSDALDSIASKANVIPGFRLLTIVLGVNPVNMAPVDRSAANLLRALLEMIPVIGALVVQALDNHGIFAKVGAWVEVQVRALGMVGSAMKGALDTFLGTLKWSDIFDLGGVWERAKRIFTEPIDRLLAFGKSLVTQIVAFVRGAILLPLAKLAEGTRGYDLLKAVLGEDPVTGVAVPRNAETLIGGFMKLIGQDEVWENIKKGNAVSRAWAWFQKALAGLMGFARQIPTLFVAAFHALEISDLLIVPRAFAKLAAVFGGFIVDFLNWAGNTVWTLLEIIFEVVSPTTLAYLKKTGAALKSIIKDPMPFVRNLIRAAKLGFQNFGDNFGAHLKAGLIDWLTGSLPGVYIPKAFSLGEIVKFVFSVLGLTWANIRPKLVKATSETAVKAMETGFDIVVTLVTQGPAAAWDKIQEQLAALKDQVISGIVDMVIDTVIKKAVPKLISMFIPGAGFISAILSIYDTIMVFIDKLAKMVAVVKAFVDGIVAIAAGQIDAAAKRVETSLAGLLSLAISFLAGFLGLGSIADKVMGVITKIRATIDKGLDALIAWIVKMAKSLFAKVFGKKDEKPDERTDAEKKRDKLAAIAEAEKLVTPDGFDDDTVRAKLGPIKGRYKLATLDLVVDAKQGQSETLHFTASASELESGKPVRVTLAATLGLVTLSKPFVAKDKAASGLKLAMTREEFRRQVGIQEGSLNKLKLSDWRRNWKAFYARDDGGRADTAQAARDRSTAIEAERLKVVATWLANNPGKPVSQANAFVDKLFAPRPGDKAYPFLNKSLVSNGATYVNEAYGKTILHAADQAVGGGSETAGLGGARENFSLGAQWDRGGRAQLLRDDVEKEAANVAKASGAKAIGESLLKVKLPVDDG